MSDKAQRRIDGMEFARRNNGQRWRSTVNIKTILHNDDLEPSESMTRIASKIKHSGHFSEIICEEIEDAAAEGDVEWFDAVLSAVYDEADDKGIWMG